MSHALEGTKHTPEHNKKISEARYKSDKVFRYPREIRKCANPLCNNTFEVRVGASEEKKYCCTHCVHRGKPSPLKGRTKETDSGVAKMAKTRTGQRCSEESKEKQSKALKGRTYVDLFGIEKAYELKELRRIAATGENHWNWKEGISQKYPIEFFEKRMTIKERDNYTCQLCGKLEIEEKEEAGRELAVHHIDHNVNNCKEENLTTLCCRCNSIVNGSESFWMNFFIWKLKLPQMFLN